MGEETEVIAVLKGIKDSVLQAIQVGFELASPGVQTKEIEHAVMKTLGMDETISIQQVRVAAGKKLDLEDNQDVSVLKGDWVWIQVNCQRNGLVVSLARLSLVGEPSSEEQMDFLSHLHDAVDWMVETIRPNKKMAFYFTESRGRSILPRAFSLDPNSIGELLIGPGKSFQMMTGSVFSVEPVVQSADFGDVFINQMVYLDEEQLVVI